MGGLKRVVQRMEKRPTHPFFVGAKWVPNSGTEPYQTVISLPEASSAGDICYIASAYNQTEMPAGFIAFENWVMKHRVDQWIKHGYKILNKEDISAGHISFNSVPSTSGYAAAICVLRGASAAIDRGCVESDPAMFQASFSASPTDKSLGWLSVACDFDLRFADWKPSLPLVLKSITASPSGRYDLAFAFWEGRRAYAGQKLLWEWFGNDHGTGSNLVGLIELRP